MPRREGPRDARAGHSRSPASLTQEAQGHDNVAISLTVHSLARDPLQEDGQQPHETVHQIHLHVNMNISSPGGEQRDLPEAGGQASALLSLPGCADVPGDPSPAAAPSVCPSAAAAVSGARQPRTPHTHARTGTETHTHTHASLTRGAGGNRRRWGGARGAKGRGAGGEVFLGAAGSGSAAAAAAARWAGGGRRARARGRVRSAASLVRAAKEQEVASDLGLRAEVSSPGFVFTK